MCWYPCFIESLQVQPLLFMWLFSWLPLFSSRNTHKEIYCTMMCSLWACMGIAVYISCTSCDLSGKRCFNMYLWLYIWLCVGLCLCIEQDTINQPFCSVAHLMYPSLYSVLMCYLSAGWVNTLIYYWVASMVEQSHTHWQRQKVHTLKQLCETTQDNSTSLYNSSLLFLSLLHSVSNTYSTHAQPCTITHGKLCILAGHKDCGLYTCSWRRHLFLSSVNPVPFAMERMREG